MGSAGWGTSASAELARQSDAICMAPCMRWHRRMQDVRATLGSSLVKKLDEHGAMVSAAGV